MKLPWRNRRRLLRRLCASITAAKSWSPHPFLTASSNTSIVGMAAFSVSPSCLASSGEYFKSFAISEIGVKSPIAARPNGLNQKTPKRTGKSECTWQPHESRTIGRVYSQS